MVITHARKIFFATNKKSKNFKEYFSEMKFLSKISSRIIFSLTKKILSLRGFDRNGANSVKISIFSLIFRPLHLTPFAHKADEEARPPVMIAGHEGQQMAFDNDETLQQQLDFITSSSVPAHNGAFSQFFSSEDTSVL